jgi:hypothetical protein
LAGIALLAFIAMSAFSFHRTQAASFGLVGPRTTVIRSGTFVGPASRAIQYPADGSTQVRGVVTAVNGNTLTVAGNGTTRSVTISSSTQYSGGLSVAVDDTIIATGSVSSTTFNATAIVVNP